MAVDTSEGNKAMDYDEHLRTYERFVNGAIYLTGAGVLILVLLAIFLV